MTTATRETIIGDPVDRVDGPLKVTGAAPYPSDFTFPDLTHAVLVQSTIAAGTIGGIDTAKAEAAPGVLAVITHENAPALADAPMHPFGPPPPFPLRDNRILHQGQHVAVVVARTREQAVAAARLVEISYEEVAPVLSIADPRAPVLLDRWGQDVDRGDVTAALASAEVVYDQTFTTAAVTPNPMGLFATVARWDGNRLTVHDSSQDPMFARKTLATVFGLPETDVRVLVPYLGGGIRGRTPRLAARDLDRARGPGRGPPGQAGADPAADVHVGRPPAGDPATGAARCHPRWPADGDGSRVHRDNRGRGRRRGRARHAAHRQCLLLPERGDPRPAGAAAHPEPPLDARPRHDPGQLRGGVRARRAVLHARHRPDRAAAAQLRRGSSGVGAAVVEQGTAGVLPRRCRAIRLGAPYARDRIDARRELAGRLRNGRSHVHARARHLARPRCRSAATAPRTCAAPPPTSVPAPTRSRHRSRPSCSDWISARYRSRSATATCRSRRTPVVREWRRR